ncbi:MAG: NUDIX domain-containing protein [Pseudomonadota bacterium]|nr:NUDIX domain-containing protein [Pseudomonadota bacterium]
MAIEVIETAASIQRQRFKLIPAVYALVRNEAGDYLLGLRKNTGYADGLWALPAGHLDGKETARAGLRREAREELGIDIGFDDMRVVLVMHRLAPTRECVDFFIEVTRWGGEIRNNEPEFCSALEFFPLDKLPENFIPYERYAFENILKGQSYCEFGWPAAC